MPAYDMQELLSKLTGCEVAMVCVGGSRLRGKIANVSDGLVQLTDNEGETCYVAIEKIVAVWEKQDKSHHPGFVFKS